MDQKRKEVIVQEILYWKNSKLLPEKYCEYLYSLYTEGELEESGIKARKEKKDYLQFAFTFFLMMTCVMGASLLFFTNLFFPLQLAVFTVVTMIQFAIVSYFYKNPILFGPSLMILNFSVFINMIFIITKNSTNSFVSIGFILAFIAALLTQGKIFSLKSFTYLGITVFLLGIAFIGWTVLS